MKRGAIFLVGTMGLGGHLRSSLTIASELRRRGWEIVFAGADCGGSQLVLDQAFDRMPIGPVLQGPRKAFVPTLQGSTRVVELARGRQLSILHAFDYGGLALAMTASALAPDLRVALTICGGTLPVFPIPSMHPIVVFQPELRDQLPARVRTTALVNGARVEFERNPSGRRDSGLVIMISRVARSKMPAIAFFLEVAHQAANLTRDLRFVLIGRDQDGSTAEVLRRMGNGPGLISWERDDVRNPARWLERANMVLGIGRTFIESFAVGTHCVLLASTGGVVFPDRGNIERIAYFNFSGRGTDDMGRMDDPLQVASSIRKLIADESKLANCCDEVRQWLKDRFDVSHGGDFYEGLYAGVDRWRGPGWRDLLRSQLYSGVKAANLLWNGFRWFPGSDPV